MIRKGRKIFDVRSALAKERAIGAPSVEKHRGADYAVALGSGT
jgi:hypothetical protein